MEPPLELTPLKPVLPKSVLPLPRSPPLVQLFDMELLSIVTAAVSAMARPQRIVAPVFRVMLLAARIFPANAVVVPRVAELPTSKYTLSVEVPFITSIADALAVVKWIFRFGIQVLHWASPRS